MKKSILRKAGLALKRACDRCTHRDAKDRLQDITFHTDGYAEPGYTDPKGGVIATGNWNNISKYETCLCESAPQSYGKLVVEDDTLCVLGKKLEKLGVELEWSDEWMACDECRKLVRTVANSYGWTRSYWESDYGVTCADCVRKDPGDYLAWLEENDSACMTFEIDLGAHGYQQIPKRFENGLYGGQSADPKKIGKLLRDRNIHRYLFVVDEVGQFDMRFSVWVHDDDFEKVGNISDKDADGADPAVALENGLRRASIAVSALAGDGIKIVQIQPDGSVNAKCVSAQDFIEGRARD